MNGVQKETLLGYDKLNLSLARLKGYDIVVAKVRFNLYQSFININKRKGWPKIGISLHILDRKINYSKMIRSLRNIICKNQFDGHNSVATKPYSIAAAVPSVDL